MIYLLVIATIVSLIMAPFLTIYFGLHLEPTIASAVAASITTVAVSVISIIFQFIQWERDDLDRLETERKRLQEAESLLPAVRKLLTHVLTEHEFRGLVKQQQWERLRADILGRIGTLVAGTDVNPSFVTMADLLYNWDGTYTYIGSGPPECPEELRAAVDSFEQNLSNSIVKLEAQIQSIKT